MVRNKVKAVIFDMDGVITNTMPDHFRAWKIIFAQQKINVSHLDIYEREGQKGLQSVIEIFQAKGKSISNKTAKIILRDKEALFQKIFQRRFVVGARTFLRDLKRQGLCLGLVTGTSREELNQMLPKRIMSRFDVIVTGTDVENGKPHPEPYLRALKKMKLQRREVIVIENAPFGIRSAKAAGLKCLALATSLSAEYLKEADGVFSSIRDLISKVKFIKL